MSNNEENNFQSAEDRTLLDHTSSSVQLTACMNSTEAIAERFSTLDFHDDTLISMKASPKQYPDAAAAAVVEIKLLRAWERTERVIRFNGCANLRVAMDFDVLADNLWPNTSGVTALSDLGKVREFIRSQQKDWGVSYGPQASSPIDSKLAAIDELAFFRVQFFGGAVEVIARGYEVEVSSSSIMVPQ